MVFRLNKKKAYVQIDFTFAIFLYMIFFLSIYSIYSNHQSSMDLSFKDNKINSESSDICKLLLSGPGSPNDWEFNISSLEFLGLLNKSSNFIDLNKVSNLNSTDYYNITNISNFNYFINFKLLNISNNYSYLDFGFASKNFTSKINSISSCYGILSDKSKVKLIVEVWE